MTSANSLAESHSNVPTNASGTPAPKLRDSCHACASSKLKCSKEKPTCARCAKRRRPCEYFVTRRGGRRHYRPTTSAPNTTFATNPGVQQASSSISVATTTKTPPQATLQTDVGPTIVYLDKYGSNLADIEPMSPEHSSDGRHPSGASPSDMDMDMDLMLDDYSAIASPLTFDISDLTSINTELGSLTNDSTMSAITDYSFDITRPVDFGGTGGGNPLIPPEVPLHQQPPPLAALNSDDFTLSATDSVHVGAASSASGHLCNCHARALEVLNQLCSLGGGSADSSPGEGSLQALLDANEHMLDAVGDILPCECSKDGFLLVTMSLVAFKVMARYEVAARRQMPSWFCAAQIPTGIMETTEESIGRGSARSHEKNVPKGPLDGRIAAQVVLSELYRVQRFVRGLAKQLKEMAGLDMSANSSVERLVHNSSHHGYRDTDFLMGGIFNDPALPFSAAFFCQLETDLRRRLRGLSKELADLVRTI